MQATQPTTPAAPPEARALSEERAAYQLASHVRNKVVKRLATVPRSDGVIGDSAGFIVRLNFGVDAPTGVEEVAKLYKATPHYVASGSWLETRVTVDGVLVVAEVLMSHAAHHTFEPPVTLAAATAAEQPLAADQPSSSEPVPLGESPVAQEETDAYDQSMDRYVASLGGSVVALVPAVEAPAADPSTISFAAVTADTAGGEQ